MSEQVLISPYKRVMSDVDRESIIRFQLICHCYLHDIELNSARLQCLTILGSLGKTDLSKFCDLMLEKQVFTSMGSIYSRLTVLQRLGMVVKSDSKYRKTIQLHPDMKIQTAGNIMVDIKLLSLENKTDVSEEGKGSNN